MEQPLPTIERVRFTDAIREVDAFQKSARHIDEACARGATQAVKRRLKKLIEHLLANPSEQTLYFFIEISARWGYHVDAYPILEAHWQSWATLEQRIQMLRQKYGWSPQALEFIDDIETAITELDGQANRLAFSYALSSLVALIVDCCPNCRLPSHFYPRDCRRTNHPVIHHNLRDALLALLELRYGRTSDVSRLIKNYMERQRRQSSQAQQK